MVSKSASASRLTRAALAFSAVIVGAVGFQVLPATAEPAPDLGPRITASAIVARAQQWVQSQVPYSEQATAADGRGHRYRTDCSGFVSMAWQLPRSLTTRTLPTVSVALGAVGDYRRLQPGDLLDSTVASHAVLFLHWADRSHRTAVVMEEPHPGAAARIDSAYYTTALLADQSFVAYRYARRIDATPARRPKLKLVVEPARARPVPQPGPGIGVPAFDGSGKSVLALLRTVRPTAR
jgi:hypothetical protein